MSMLSSQADRLRLTADIISERGVSSGDLAIVEIRLREAADTITILSDKLQGVMGTRYCELFGTPDRAARTLSIMQRCELGIIGNCEDCEMHDACRVRDGDYDALLEWLRGDA